jgi:cell division septum initiation protein DivIVA
MTSKDKIVANRQNAKKSTGPRTATGKSRASRNASRHGLERANFGDAGHSAQVERIAKAIYREGVDPFLQEQAVIIAESQIFIARVRAARLAAVERIRASDVKRVQELPILPGFATLEERERAFADLEQGNLQTATRMMNRISSALRIATKALVANANGETDNINAAREALRAEILQGVENDKDRIVSQAPDDIECLSRALPDLLSLERYERRALSRRRRAIRRFDALRD